MNKLQKMMKWYKLTIESQRVTLKILNSSSEVVLLDSSLAEYKLSEAKKILLKAENELNVNIKNKVKKIIEAYC